MTCSEKTPHPPWRQWRHVFKLDPDRPLSDAALERICRSGTDAVMVGGSTGVTYENTEQLLRRIQQFSVPALACALEISDEQAVVPGFDTYFVPLVLNTSDTRWLIGKHQQAVKAFDGLVPWELVAAEGYVILNGQAAAAYKTGADTELDEYDVLAYAHVADRLMRLPILYVEYSGMIGDLELVQRISAQLTSARLFYGGGIDGADKAEQAARAADTVIVGNAVYEHLDAALATVAAVKSSVKG